MYDLSVLAVAETATIELTDPSGEPLFNDDGERLSVTVYGPGSRQYQTAQAHRNQAIMESLRKRTRKLSAVEQRELDADFLAQCTASFNGFGYKGLSGREQYRAAYLDAGIGWLAEQINSELGDWGNYTAS